MFVLKRLVIDMCYEKKVVSWRDCGEQEDFMMQHYMTLGDAYTTPRRAALLWTASNVKPHELWNQIVLLY